MDTNELLDIIRKGIRSDYRYDEFVLTEPLEKMSVPFYRKESPENFVLIRPKDNEKDHLYACFSDETERKIADYLGFFSLDNEIIGAIFELKKRKTSDNATKASEQIRASYPLLKMIFEKTTGMPPDHLRVIGIRVFGPNKKPNRTDKLDLPLTEEQKQFVILSYQQQHENAALISISDLKKKLQERKLLW